MFHYRRGQVVALEVTQDGATRTEEATVRRVGKDNSCALDGWPLYRFTPEGFVVNRLDIQTGMTLQIRAIRQQATERTCGQRTQFFAADLRQKIADGRWYSVGDMARLLDWPEPLTGHKLREIRESEPIRKRYNSQRQIYEYQLERAAPDAQPPRVDRVRAKAIVEHPGLQCDRCAARASILTQEENARCRRCHRGTMRVKAQDQPNYLRPQAYDRAKDYVEL